MIINAIRGFCMALADSVPGVSGGTIAFLLGFYDEFINSLNNLFRGDKKERITAIKFVLKLGIGWVIGMILAVSILASFFTEGIYKVSSLFIGFILFAIPVMIKEERKCLKGKYFNLIFLVLGILLIVFVANLKIGIDVSVSNLSIWMYLYIFVSGMFAVSAMVLPGISGSTILLSFGLYIPVITAIKDFLHMDFNGFWLLVALGLGIIAGVFVSLKDIKKLLDKFRSATIYTVVGMMIGSLYAIVLGPTTLKVPVDALSLSTFNWLFFIIGGLVVLVMELVKHNMEKKKLS